MNARLFTLLNVKPAEAALVKQLLTVQFFLGIATSFLSTSALTIFLAKFDSHEFPKVFLVTAGLLFFANYAYGWLEQRFAAKKLLQVIIYFSAASVAATWFVASFLSYTWLPFFEASWNMVVYMVVGYAFWGMAAVMFNVRESKRLFTVVGSGDIPAKILGYASVSVLAPLLGVESLFLISVAAFLVAAYYLRVLRHQAISNEEQGHGEHHAAHHHTENSSVFQRIFHNRFIFSIALWSFVAYLIFLLIDFTFLADIKSTYQDSPALASFIGIFFAVGRILAVGFKLLFSSRVIGRVGLANTLLITPAFLFLITMVVFFNGDNPEAHLYLFGAMVLFSEVLKSAVQDPAFFILFQPLTPHDRLKGHLITKGYTLPFALVGVGLFAYIILDDSGQVSILFICQMLVLLLVVWVATVYFIRKEYSQTLINALKKGFFTGSTLFLQDEPVRRLLLEKIASNNAKEIVLALELLERSRYSGIDRVLLEQLQSTHVPVLKYVLGRAVKRHLHQALPQVAELLQADVAPELRAGLLKAYYALGTDLSDDKKDAFTLLSNPEQKAALLGLATRKDVEAVLFRESTLNNLVNSTAPADRLLALDIIAESTVELHARFLATLLHDPDARVWKRTMEVIGQRQELGFLRAMVQTAITRNNFIALEQALLHFGDPVFEESRQLHAITPTESFPDLIKVAAKIKGIHTTQFLARLLAQENSPLKDAVVDALWQKKAVLEGSTPTQLDSWLQDKLSQAKQKIGYFQSLQAVPEAADLTKALASEVKQDAQLILKALALRYERTRIDRVMDLLNRQDQSKTSNAIELLELLIPKRLFTQVDVLLEFLLDYRTGAAMRLTGREQSVPQALTEILVSDEAGCSTWTKAVAFYVLPKLHQSLLPAPQVWQSLPNVPDPLLEETHAYALASLSR